MPPAQIPSHHIRNVALDLVFTLLTCGLYNFYIQAKQMDAVNDMLKQRKYTFVPWLIFTILTCGLYHIYHEYRMSLDIERVLGRENSIEPILAVVLSALALPFVVDAIQQTHINHHYGSEQL